jgi:hypothetical protein
MDKIISEKKMKREKWNIFSSESFFEEIILRMNFLFL